MSEPTPITATMLYDLVQCPHRVTMDLYGDASERVPVNEFVRLLWEKGTLYEREVMAALELPYVDLSQRDPDTRVRLTLEAMDRGEALIYQGRIAADDLLGEPDLLRREGDGYAPIDIKSGAGEEGKEDVRRAKKHYAVQLALYVDVLERMGRAAGRRAYVWDVHGEEVVYDLAAARGPRQRATLWDEYRETLAAAREIAARHDATRPAYAGVCKLCPWYATCLDAMRRAGDLTLVPELGRAARDAMLGEVASIRALAECDPQELVRGVKTVFAGIGAERLRKFHRRARLQSEGGEPYLRAPVELPQLELELFFDIESDPFRDLCYLHGFVERRRRDDSSERYLSFFAEDESDEAERRAFADAIAYMRSSRPCAIYYYSKYERTMYRRLREKYPEVVAEGELEALFDPAHAIDLYHDVVLKASEWPTRDFSIKTLARHLGFEWRDQSPSGAASIEWFHRWTESFDPAVRQRILDYNEDDCRATRVLRDAIEHLPLER